MARMPKIINSMEEVNCGNCIYSKYMAYEDKLWCVRRLSRPWETDKHILSEGHCGDGKWLIADSDSFLISTLGGAIVELLYAVPSVNDEWEKKWIALKVWLREGIHRLGLHSDGRMLLEEIAEKMDWMDGDK